MPDDDNVSRPLTLGDELDAIAKISSIVHDFDAYQVKRIFDFITTRKRGKMVGEIVESIKKVTEAMENADNVKP